MQVVYAVDTDSVAVGLLLFVFHFSHFYFLKCFLGVCVYVFFVVVYFGVCACVLSKYFWFTLHVCGNLSFF